MGAWNAAINGNDEFMEVYEAFDQVYSNYKDKAWTYTLEETRKILEEHFAHTVKEEGLSHNYYFALALRFWELGIDDKQIVEKVTTIISSGADLEYWKGLDAKSETLAKRKKALDEFLIKISTSNPKPRARKKITKKEPAFYTGDLVAFKFEDHYYVAVTTSHEVDTQGQFVLRLLNYRSADKPVKEELLDCEFMLLEFTDIFGKKSKKYTGFHITNNELKKATLQYEKIGAVSLHEYGYYYELKGAYSEDKQTADIMATYAKSNYDKAGFGGKMLLKYYADPYRLDQQMMRAALQEIKKGMAVKFFDITLQPAEIILKDSYGSIYFSVKDDADFNEIAVGNLLSQLLAEAFPRTSKRPYDIYFDKYDEIKKEELTKYVSMQAFFSK